MRPNPVTDYPTAPASRSRTEPTHSIIVTPEERRQSGELLLITPGHDPPDHAPATPGADVGFAGVG
jgi:hypothetical protein